MEKPILFYEVRPQTNRATGATVLVPAIVDREQAIPLDEIIRRAIDRGLIAGIKPSAAEQVADAVAQQMYEEFRQGRSVKFGNYFYARLYLDGTSDSDGRLTAANGVNVRFVNGAGFLISEADGAERGLLVPGANVILNGVNLWMDGDAATRVAFFLVDDESGEAADVPTAEITDFATKGPNALKFAWADALEAGRTYLAVPSRSADGERWFTGTGRTAKVKEA